MKQFNYLIKNELGIHARPAGMLVKSAEPFCSNVSIANGDKTADAKHLFELLRLTVKCGDKVTVTCEGEDEDNAAAALEVFFTQML